MQERFCAEWSGWGGDGVLGELGELGWQIDYFETLGCIFEDLCIILGSYNELRIINVKWVLRKTSVTSSSCRVTVSPQLKYLKVALSSRCNSRRYITWHPWTRGLSKTTKAREMKASTARGEEKHTGRKPKKNHKCNEILIT